MMTIDEIRAMFEAIENTTIWFDTFHNYNGFDTILNVIIEDFEGFDEDYSEIYCDYDEQAIDAIIERLNQTCIEIQEDWHKLYVFDGFAVEISYTSEDI